MKKISQTVSFFLVLAMAYGFVAASGGEFVLFGQSLDAGEYKQTVEFGTYEYNDTTAALKWEVVETDLVEGTATLLLKEAIPGLFLPFNNVNYNEDGANVWADSSLNTYLNTTFFEGAFTEADKEKLVALSTDIHVTIPSAAEYYSWYYEPTERVDHVGSTYNWWLRDPGQAAHYSAVAMYVVKGAGRVVQVGTLVNTLMAVRPVIKVDGTVADMLKTYEPPAFTTATVGGVSASLGLGVVGEDFDALKAGGLLENLRGSVTLTEAQAEDAMADFVSQQNYRLSPPTASPSTEAAQNGIDGKWYANAYGTAENTLAVAGQGCALKDGDILILQARDFSDSGSHVFFWIDVIVEPAPEWPIRVDATIPDWAAKLVNAVSIAGFEVQLGGGHPFDSTGSPSGILDSITALKGNEASQGRVVITEAEAQDAAFVFNNNSANCNLRTYLVRKENVANDSAWQEAATRLSGSSDQVSSPQSLSDGDVLLVYLRTWSNPHFLCYININVVSDTPPSP